MALMTFVKGGVTTVTLSRGDSWPRASEDEDGQIFDLPEGDGPPWVATIRQKRAIIPLTLTLPEADYLALVAFFANVLVNYRANTCTWTDFDSTSRTVRYWGGLIPAWPQVSYGMRQGTLRLRIE